MSTRRTRTVARFIAGTSVLIMIAAAAARLRSSSSSGGDQTLRIAEGVEQPTLDPAKNIQYLSDEMAAIYDTLVVVNKDGSIGPSLAESWTVDGPSITFKLRSGVKFHDGTPFNADAVKFALDRVVDPATKATNSKSVLGPYASSTVVDANTVTVTWKTPVGAALINLSNADLGIPSPTAAKAGTLDAKPVGTGPYKFVSYTKGDRLEVERNADYSTIRPDLTNKGAPKYAKIIFQYVTNASTRANLLSTGGVAGRIKLTGPDAKRLAAAPTLNNASFPGVSEVHALDQRQERARPQRAQGHLGGHRPQSALPLQAVAGGYAEVNPSVLPTIVPGYDKSAASALVGHDQAKAKDLLAAAELRARTSRYDPVHPVLGRGSGGRRWTNSSRTSWPRWASRPPSRPRSSPPSPRPGARVTSPSTSESTASSTRPVR